MGWARKSIWSALICPLNVLRAFEASARHLSFTRAAIELCVTQAAISHQVKTLEARPGVSLFRRLPRGLALTDEGMALLPALAGSFDRIGELVEGIASRQAQHILSVGVVGTFATGWLLPRLVDFRALYPRIDLRLFTNNNRVDLAGEGLDCAKRCCDPIAPTNGRAGSRLPGSPRRRSKGRCSIHRWRSSWRRCREGVALAPSTMFAHALATEIAIGHYWLTLLKSPPMDETLGTFRDWLTQRSAEED